MGCREHFFFVFLFDRLIFNKLSHYTKKTLHGANFLYLRIYEQNYKSEIKYAQEYVQYNITEEGTF
jgi:hypothetical protein